MSPEPQRSDAQQPIVIHPPVSGDVNGSAPVPADTIPVKVAVPPPVPAVIPPEAPVAAEPARPRRAHSLDALRGLFLVSMTLGFSLRGIDYPAWMYHRQMPPPDFGIEPIAGLGWRDLAYGAFIFTMATALPLTLSRRVAKGETEVGIMAAALKRYGLLLLFALLVGHANTYFIGYTQTGRVLALAGLLIIGLVYARPRPDWNAEVFKMVNRAGWALALAFLAFSPLAYGQTFAFTRIDDVIAGLAFAALVGSVIWYFTRDNLLARVAALAFAVALYLGSREGGWVQQWWYSSPAPWAFAPSRLSLLTLVIPGTIAGDAVLRWMRTSDAAPAAWSAARMMTLAALAFAFAPVLVVGTYLREMHVTTQVCLAMAFAGLFLTLRPATSVERTARALFLWGASWILLGLFVEPLEGGIKKVPETLSYFFTVAGITTMLLVALVVLVDGLGRRRWAAPLIDVGHNPLLMYVILSLGITSATELIEPLRGFMRDSPWLSFTRSAIETTMAVLIVRFASKKRVYLRT